MGISRKKLIVHLIGHGGGEQLPLQFDRIALVENRRELLGVGRGYPRRTCGRGKCRAQRGSAPPPLPLQPLVPPRAPAARPARTGASARRRSRCNRPLLL
jgi:hypothetical protein